MALLCVTESMYVDLLPHFTWQLVPDKSKTKAIFLSRRLKNYRERKDILMISIDLEKAYYRLRRSIFGR